MIEPSLANTQVGSRGQARCTEARDHAALQGAYYLSYFLRCEHPATLGLASYITREAYDAALAENALAKLVGLQFMSY